MVKERCKCIRCVRYIVDHQAKVSEVAVLVINQRIKNQHIRKGIIILLTKRFKIF